MGNIDKQIIKARTMAELKQLLGYEKTKDWYIASEIKHFDEQYAYQVLMHREKFKTSRVSL